MVLRRVAGVEPAAAGLQRLEAGPLSCDPRHPRPWKAGKGVSGLFLTVGRCGVWPCVASSPGRVAGGKRSRRWFARDFRGAGAWVATLTTAFGGFAAARSARVIDSAALASG